MAESKNKTLNNTFYRDSYLKILFVLLLSITINILFSCVLIYLIMNPKIPAYYSTSIRGRSIRLTPLSMPNQSDSAVLQWANQAAIAAYTYNFLNYEHELKKASTNFTVDGWSQFRQALDASGNLKVVRQKKLIVSAVATKSPIILQKGPLLGKYAWRVQMPLLVSYQSASSLKQINNVVTLLITRVSTNHSVRGIGIEQMNVDTPGQL